MSLLTNKVIGHSNELKHTHTNNIILSKHKEIHLSKTVFFIHQDM